MIMLKKKSNQMELNFGSKPQKKRRFPLAEIKARLAKLKFIKCNRIEAEEETANYWSHVTHLHKLFGKPPKKNIEQYIKTIESEASQEDRIARGFSGSNDKGMQETHYEMSSHYARYARALTVTAKNKK